jgi:ribosome maturation factor RimP
MSTLSNSLHDDNHDALRRVVEPVVRAHGAELVELELRSEQSGWVLRVTVEKAGATANRLSTRDAAVDLELCADISRDLSPALDVADLVPHAYHLEVGSPGVERRLRTEPDFLRFAGHKAKIKLKEPVAGQRVVVGVLGGVTGGKVRLELTERGRGAKGAPAPAAAIELPLAAINEARLVFELTARPKGAAARANEKRAARHAEDPKLKRKH